MLWLVYGESYNYQGISIEYRSQIFMGHVGKPLERYGTPDANQTRDGENLGLI